MSGAQDNITSPVSFFDAKVGDLAYTWENSCGGWGDYAFETVDPEETGAWDPNPGDVLIRKTWKLVDIVETVKDDE